MVIPDGMIPDGLVVTTFSWNCGGEAPPEFQGEGNSGKNVGGGGGDPHHNYQQQQAQRNNKRNKRVQLLEHIRKGVIITDCLSMRPITVLSLFLFHGENSVSYFCCRREGQTVQ
jgi:hypothetical protein